MILSTKNGFLFIKGHKVAGTSIEMVLSRLCGSDDIVTPLLPIDERERLGTGGSCRNYSGEPRFEAGYLKILAGAATDELPKLRPPPPIFYNHMPLTDVIRRYRGSLEGLRVVCAERSPYAKVLSWLNMQRALPAYMGGGAMRSDPSGFCACFDRAHARGAIGSVRNIDLYRDEAGRLDVRVLRYEALQSDVDLFLEGIGAPPAKLPHAKKGLMSNGLDVRAVLRRDQIDVINMVFAEEFDTFGYERL